MTANWVATDHFIDIAEATRKHFFGLCAALEFGLGSVEHHNLDFSNRLLHHGRHGCAADLLNVSSRISDVTTH